MSNKILKAAPENGEKPEKERRESYIFSYSVFNWL